MKEKNQYTVCPNCQAKFDKSYQYCPECGQENKEINLGLKYFITELLSGMFNVDSKIFRTLRLLFFYPGKLTKEFIAGKRNSYISPVRLYLIGSLIYFTVVSLISDPVVSDNTNIDKKSLIIIQDDSLQIAQKTDTVFTVQTKDSAYFNLLTEEKIRALKTQRGKERFVENFRRYMPIGMFVFVPLTALLFFILFRRKNYYVEHLIFVLHLQTLFYLLLTLISLFDLLYSGEGITTIYFIFFVCLLILWVKRYYGIRWLKAIWKTFLFLFIYGFVFLVFFISVMVVSFYTL